MTADSQPSALLPYLFCALERRDDVRRVIKAVGGVRAFCHPYPLPRETLKTRPLQ
jgi:hypothetical protein